MSDITHPNTAPLSLLGGDCVTLAGEHCDLFQGTGWRDRRVVVAGKTLKWARL